MKNRYFTILIVPEKSAKVRRFTVPAWLARGSLLGMAFLGLLAVILIIDYGYVLGQIDENKELRVENRRLRQQVQIFRNKIATVESTMERIQTFATRLKVITHITGRENLTLHFDETTAPNADTNVGKKSEAPTALDAGSLAENPYETALLKKDAEELDEKFAAANARTLDVEQNLQDLYELLIDQKDFLNALPTSQPAFGYFTSGFGVRRSPYGGREKMHEGIDIANHPQTEIRAPAHALVSFAGVKPGYGQVVVLDHGYGLETLYGHASRLVAKKGQKIRRGEVIALMGSTGRSTGSHVHYEVRINGIPVDPLSYILESEGSTP